MKDKCSLGNKKEKEQLYLPVHNASPTPTPCKCKVMYELSTIGLHYFIFPSPCPHSTITEKPSATPPPANVPTQWT